MSIKSDVLPQYLGSGDPALKDYYPEWLKNMAGDATKRLSARIYGPCEMDVKGA